MPSQILIIDDEEPVLEVLSTFLRRHGYGVWAEAEMESALNILESIPIDLVFLDVCLNEGDGCEFIEAMRSRRPDLAIVIFTGINFDQDLVDVARQLGALGCIRKTTPFPQLLEHIQSILGRREQLAYRWRR